MTDTLKAFEKADQKLFEAQQEIKSLRVQVEQLSRVNNEYGEVLTPIWDYCRENVKVELGKSITEALIESHKELVTKVWSLEQRCKLLEEDSKDTAKYVEIQRGELAKANEQKIVVLDKLVETVETVCDKHDVPIHGYQHNKAMQRTMLNIFRKAKDAMVEQLSKEQDHEKT